MSAIDKAAAFSAFKDVDWPLVGRTGCAAILSTAKYALIPATLCTLNQYVGFQHEQIAFFLWLFCALVAWIAQRNERKARAANKRLGQESKTELLAKYVTCLTLSLVAGMASKSLITTLAERKIVWTLDDLMWVFSRYNVTTISNIAMFRIYDFFLQGIFKQRLKQTIEKHVKKED